MKKILLTMVLGMFGMLAQEVNAQVVCYVTNPTAVRGSYEHGFAASGWNYDIDTVAAIGQLVVGRSTVSDSLACDTLPFANAAAVAGKIAVVYRGACQFGYKAYSAQLSGAIGVIIINNVAGVLNLAGGDLGLRVDIPVVLISDADGAALRPFIDGDSTVALIGQKRGQFANDIGFTVGNLIRPVDFAVSTLEVANAGDYAVKMGANVVNYGQNAQTNVELDVTIDFTDPSGTSSTVYSQSATLASLAVDSSQLLTVPDFDPNAYGAGTYEITYEVTSSVADDFDGDNSSVQIFIVNDSIYTKARLDGDNKPFASGGVRPSDATTGPYEIGLWYYTGANGHRVKVNKIKFGFVTNAGTNLANETVLAKVSQWMDMNQNGLFDPGEITELAEGFYTYNDSLGSGDVREVEVADIITGSAGYTLDSNAVFMFSVAYTGASDQVFISIDPGMDYTTSVGVYQQRISPVYVTTWNVLGFGPDRVPSIAAVFEELPANVSVENKIRNDLNIRLFPNPVRDELNIRMGATDDILGDITYEVMDISGRVVLRGEKNVDSFTDQMTLSVSQLQQGVYTLVMKTKKGFNTSRFVVAN